MPDVLSYSANLDAAATAYETAASGLATAPLTYQLFAQSLGAWDAEKMEVGYTDDLSEFRELMDGEERTYDGARAYSATYSTQIISKAFELPVGRVLGDLSGRIADMVAAAGQDVPNLPEVKIWEKMLANTVLGPDGVALFSASHPNGASGATQSNLVASALSQSTFRTALNAMRSYRSENGRYLNVTPTHLFVAQSYEQVAKEILGTDRVVAVSNAGAPDATSNVVGATTIPSATSNAVQLVVVPRMTGWCVMDLSKAGKPWVYKISPVESSSATATDESWKQKNLARWYSQQRLVQGPGHWQLAYRSTT